MDDKHGGYSRDEVLSVERWAWAGELADGRPEFFYDGIDFWRHGMKGSARAVRAGQAPEQGWRHKDDCNCGLCRAKKA